MLMAVTRQLHTYPSSKKGHIITGPRDVNVSSLQGTNTCPACIFCDKNKWENTGHEILTAEAMKIILGRDTVQTDTDISEERNASIFRVE
jgi:hypothetical protein